MSALRDLVEKNIALAQAGLRGMRGDARMLVAKAGDSAVLPQAQQVDQPQGLSDTPPALTAAAEDMKEGIDLFDRNHLNGLYQRYGPQQFHKAMRHVPAEHLHHHAANAPVDHETRHALLAAAAVQKAFSGRPGPSDPAPGYPDSSPRITIPANAGRPLGNGGLTSNWRLQAAPVPRPAGFNDPGTWVLQDTPSGGSEPDGEPVGRQWVFHPATGNPVAFASTAEVGVGHKGDDDHDDGPSTPGPQPGDLVRFHGPGGSEFESRTVMLTTGHAIGEFDGQSVIYPLDAIRGHSPGGADHAADQGTPGGLSGRRGPRPLGVGQKSPDGSEFGPRDGSSNVSKAGWDGDAARADALRYAGGGLSTPAAQKKYRSFFLVCEGDPANKGSYKFPYKRLVGGKPTVDPAGLRAARAMAGGARSGKKNPKASRAAADVSKASMGWDAMVEHLKGQGHSQESAERIAGAIARRKYGPRMNRKVKKALLDRASKSAHDPYYGGTPAEVGRGAVRPPLEDPDDGAPLTPYDSRPPYDVDDTSHDPGPGNKPQGGLTPTEYALIDRVVSHRGPMPVESAALKALRAGAAGDQHREVLRKALRSHSFAAPGAATACRAVERKLLP